ncbi:MAG TPA: (Fe-S)-binding protein [Gordonia sp. (in: high G+C Gram-positive bacteria)]|uniref:(Fe-S)-binding protein n=1 Tax=unclassified Gordonia (in: high G+C Gram-positive bacteria) TaxID=2657482 RepID=UPI0025C3D12F|nr:MULTISPECIES: (Fe-S)-binding protein [unclassified Gordonia (in: high G+C Gram-positive bacteria)]HRC50757.1 (Fe-S)-binding protein [Gordonia sp. (in: high G+C Gram-positive bacteria)]
MSATTITLGLIGALISLVCWANFGRGVSRIARTVAQGQPAPGRFFPFFPRLWTMLKEFLAHTRMNKFRTVGWAHWLVMIGFLGGFPLFFEAYGQSINPEFHWPVIGNTFGWHLWDEILGIGTVVGIVTLIIIRQLNHPRVPSRLSRFSGSRFVPAYTIEAIVLVEGLGMVFVKAGKIATYHHSNPGSDFFTMQVAKLLPASPTMVAVFALIKLLSGSLFLFLVGNNVNWGVAWHRFAAFPNIFFKREADGGVALGPLKPMTSGGRALTMETADPDNDAFGAGKIEDFSWKALLDFTTCTECGRCQSQCPAWNTGKPLSPKILIMSLRDHAYEKAPYLLAGGRTDMGGEEVGLVDADGNELTAKLEAIPEAARAQAQRPLVGEANGNEGGAVIDTETLWSCTNCGACVEQCPVDIEHVDHIVDMRRYQVLIESDFPSELAGLFKNLENKGNPWGQSPSARTAWIDEMDIHIPVYGKDVDSFAGFEYLFWVGCAGAYEDRAKKTTKAVAELLDVAAVNFLVLGEGETCTGDSARRAGNEFLFQMLAQQNIEQVDELFATAPHQRKKIVVTCAHCFNALGNEYPQVDGERGRFEVVHHTQLLNRLVREKRLIPVAPPTGESVTYHDPCFLGRHNQVYDAPRELVEASGSTLTEMPRHAERSMCCGAGGARMWMEEQLGKRINIDRVDEALDTLESGPDLMGEKQKIATGCPFCRVMLTDGVTAQTSGTEKEDQIEVVDVAQLLLEGVRRGIEIDVAREGKVRGPGDVEQPKAPVIEEAPAPAPSPTPKPAAAPAAAAAPADAKPAGGGLAMKGGLGMKGGMGGMKGGMGSPAASPAPEAPAAEAPAAAKGFGMKGGMGGMKGGLGKPAAAAPAAEATPAEAPVAEAPAAKGFAMKGGMGGMKGLGKPAAAAPAAEATPAEAPAAEAPAADAKPAAKGFAMKGGMGGMKGGLGKPAAAAPAAEATPAEAPAAEAPAAEAPADPKPVKGFAMKGGMNAGLGKPAATPSATAPAPTAEAPAAEAPATEAAPAEAAEAEAPAAETPAAEPKAAPAPKAKGFGMDPGKKGPGQS